MTLSEVGVATKTLPLNWYVDLTPDQLAAYVRYQFIRLNENVTDWDDRAHRKKRFVWDGGSKNRVGVPQSSVWHKIVNHIAAAGAHPGMWVQAHFSPAAERHLNVAFGLSDISHTALHSGRSAYVYNKYTQIGPELVLHAYELALDTIKLRMQATARIKLTDADRTTYVLCDEAYVTASPFFRYAFAARRNCDVAMQMYLRRAAIDYDVNQPLYDYVIANSSDDYSWWLPEELKAATTEIRNHWRNYCG